MSATERVGVYYYLSSPPEQRSDRGKQAEEGGGHPRLSLTYIVENLNVHTAERVFGNDRGQRRQANP